MNSTLATEPTTQPPAEAPDKAAVAHPLLETWSKNERMRHIPSIEWITQKLDRDVRKTVEQLWTSLAALAFDDPRRAAIEEEFRGICRAVDRLAEVARHTRGNNHPPNDLGERVRYAINHAVTNLNTVDANVFGRRFPFQTLERSKGEPLYGALLVVLHHVDRTKTLVRTVDRGLDERLLEGLVVLENPVDARMLRPIA
jgi:hypothetical protein